MSIRWTKVRKPFSQNYKVDIEQMKTEASICLITCNGVKNHQNWLDKIGKKQTSTWFAFPTINSKITISFNSCNFKENTVYENAYVRVIILAHFYNLSLKHILHFNEPWNCNWNSSNNLFLHPRPPIPPTFRSMKQKIPFDFFIILTKSLSCFKIILWKLYSVTSSFVICRK